MKSDPVNPKPSPRGAFAEPELDELLGADVPAALAILIHEVRELRIALKAHRENARKVVARQWAGVGALFLVVLAVVGWVIIRGHDRTHQQNQVKAAVAVEDQRITRNTQQFCTILNQPPAPAILQLLPPAGRAALQQNYALNRATALGLGCAPPAPPAPSR